MKLKPLALAATLALSVPSAFADDIVRSLVLTPDNGSFSAGFSATHLESSFFVDTFNFDLPSMFSGPVTAELFSSSPDLSLLGGLLGGEGFEFTSIDGGQMASITVAGLSGPQTLSVFGTAGNPFGETTPLSATYTGTITAIPEPGTYALMLAGLGLVGFMARRRSKA